ncbi:MAG: VWA domain-containing protein, partial [Chloroflexota bacterium]
MRRPTLQRSGGEGLAPFSAWEAEFTAYAHLRTGHPHLKVRFAVATDVGWSEEVHLARPSTHRHTGPAFEAAELELEHLLVHHAYGWREVVLLWHAWAHPTEPITLPWAPWDHVALPPSVVRLALAEALPALALPREREATPLRSRDAAAWLASAWADGVHLAMTVAERPGLAERLPVPMAPARAGLWEAVLYRLASRSRPQGRDLVAPTDVRVALDRLLGVEAAQVEAHVAAVLALADALAQHHALPPSHKQRPAWLRRGWGRWRREAAMRQALDDLARSPTSTAVAAATLAGRRHGTRLVGGGGNLGGLSPSLHGTGQEDSGAAGDAASRTVQDDAPQLEPQPGSEWGVEAAESFPDVGDVDGADPMARGREGRGTTGGSQDGAGPGVLGALRVVEASPADRAAYWQLRGALAPEIESLIERLRAASDEYYARVPRRFQRSGRLDRRRLPAAVAGREGVFTRFLHEPAPAHALCLLLDCSASMTTRAEHLREAAILVESAAAAVGAHVGAFAFGATWERLAPPAEGAPLVALGRELHPHGGTPFGPAVTAAAEWLLHQPYEQKRLWVFSDGQWSARDRADTAWAPHLLKDVV